jgi:predicted acylesterase/phospholipase RssA
VRLIAVAPRERPGRGRKLELARQAGTGNSKEWQAPDEESTAPKLLRVERDVAVVLSGGAVNGVLMELGFMKRLRSSGLWPRVGWVYGTSAGALTGTMAALDRLDDLEAFMLGLQPEDVFRPHRLWRLPLLGSHDYRLPRTVEERIGDTTAMARELAAAPAEVVVFATDVGPQSGEAGPHAHELRYSSRSAPPETMASAILASAAISGLVLPLRVGEHVATDGAWVRNFPLGHAYDQPGARLIVAFRYLPQYPELTIEWLERLRRRLERFRRMPSVPALVADLREAEERAARGEPAHWGDMIVRLMRVAVQQNTINEERHAIEKDESIAELASLRADVAELLRDHEELARRVDERFAATAFPFGHDRVIPRLTVRGTADGASLETGLRNQQPWTAEAKRELIERGWQLLDEELRRRGLT